MDGLANLDYVIGFAELALKGMGQAILRFERVKIEIGGNNQRQSNQVPRRDQEKAATPLASTLASYCLLFVPRPPSNLLRTLL